MNLMKSWVQTLVWLLLVFAPLEGAEISSLDLYKFGSPKGELTAKLNNFPSELGDYTDSIWRGQWIYFHSREDDSLAISCPQRVQSFDCFVLEEESLIAQATKPNFQKMKRGPNPFNILPFYAKKGLSYTFIIDQNNHHVNRKQLWIGKLSAMKKENTKLTWTFIFLTGGYLATLLLNVILYLVFRLKDWLSYILYNLFFFLIAINYIGFTEYFNPALNDLWTRSMPVLSVCAVFSLLYFASDFFRWSKKLPLLTRYLNWLFPITLVLAILKMWKPHWLIPRINLQLFVGVQFTLWFYALYLFFKGSRRARLFAIGFGVYTGGLFFLWGLSFFPFLNISPGTIFFYTGLACLLQLIVFTSGILTSIFNRKKNSIRKAQKEVLFREALLHNLTHELRTPLVGLLDPQAPFPSSLTSAGIQRLDFRKHVLFFQRLVNLIVFHASLKSIAEQEQKSKAYWQAMVSSVIEEIHQTFPNIQCVEEKAIDVTVYFPIEIIECIIHSILFQHLPYSQSGTLHINSAVEGETIVFQVQLNTAQNLSTAQEIPQEDVVIVEEILSLLEIQYQILLKENMLVHEFTFPFEFKYGYQISRTNLPLDFQERNTVLIVDDNPINRKVLKKLCTQIGLETREAENGLEAFQSVIQYHNLFRAVLMDIKMPVMDGMESTVKIREWEKKRGVSPLLIIAITAHSGTDYYQQCMDIEMDHLLQKPYKKNQIRSALMLAGEES